MAVSATLQRRRLKPMERSMSRLVMVMGVPHPSHFAPGLELSRQLAKLIR